MNIMFRAQYRTRKTLLTFLGPASLDIALVHRGADRAGMDGIGPDWQTPRRAVERHRFGQMGNPGL